MHIPQDKRIRKYELTYLISASLTNDEVSKISDVVEKLVKKHKGTVVSQEDWGKKTLAYTIQHSGKRHTEAGYRFLVLEFDTSHVEAFEKDIFLNQQLLRHLLVIADESVAKSSEAETPESDA